MEEVVVRVDEMHASSCLDACGFRFRLLPLCHWQSELTDKAVADSRLYDSSR